MRNRTGSALIAVALVIMVVSCGDNGDRPLGIADDSEGVPIVFKMTSELFAQLGSVEVVVTGIDFTPIRQELDLSGDEASGVISVPVGSDRLFTLNGYDISGDLVYTGQGWSDVLADQENTVSLEMRPVDASAPRDWLHGVVPDLAYIRFHTNTGNWDSDAEDDGIIVDVDFRGSDDEYKRLQDATLGVTYLVFIAAESFSLERKYQSPWLKYTGYLNSETIKIPFEEFGFLRSSDTYENYDGSMRVHVIEELSITMSNGAQINARNTGSMSVAD